MGVCGSVWMTLFEECYEWLKTQRGFELTKKDDGLGLFFQEAHMDWFLCIMVYFSDDLGVITRISMYAKNISVGGMVSGGALENIQLGVPNNFEDFRSRVTPFIDACKSARNSERGDQMVARGAS
jgi:hypothetical protein